MSNIKQYSKYAWVIVILGFLVAFSGSYPQYQLSALAYRIIPELGLSTSQFSGLFTGAMIPGVLLSIISGVLCDKYGAKKAIGVSAIIASAGLILRVGSDNYSTLLICMILSGVVATFLNSNVAKLLGNWFRPEQIGKAIGITLAGATAAMAIGMGTTAMFPSIKSAYIFAAVLSVIVTLGWFLFMKNKPQGGGKEQISYEQPSVSSCLKVIIKSKNVWLTALCLLCLMGSSVTLSSFAALALNVDRGINATSAGLITSFITFGNFAGTIVGPFIGAKVGRMKPYIIVCSIVAAIGTAFAWLAPAGALLIIALFITGFATSAMIPTLISLPFLFPEVGPKYAGTAGGFVATIMLIGAVVIPTYIIAPIGGTNYTLLFILAGVCAIITGLIVLGLPDMFRRENIQQ